MTRGAVILWIASGCGFQPVGAQSDAAHDAPPDACTPGLVDLCSEPSPTIPFDLSGTIDTDTDPRCSTLSSTAVCLIYGTSMVVSGSVTITGSRPLALASTTTLDVDALLDAGSYIGGSTGPAADDLHCEFGATPENDLGGAGGGAGASLGAAGGDGGTGDTDNSLGADGTALPGLHGAVLATLTLRGGCRGQPGGNESSTGGQGGAGGHGGGALYLRAARSITVTAQIRATGAGGAGGAVQSGGGGGGSGGIVILDSPAISITGQISTNGGGGGEGGGRLGATNVTGNPGADGALGTTGAAGGSGIDARLGTGGSGGATAAATSGGSSIIGAGGGGGGVGIVHLIGAVTITGVVSPPPS